MPQVTGGEILDLCQIVLGSLSLKRAEPRVDAFFRQTLAALLDKHIGACCAAIDLQVRKLSDKRQ